MEYIPRKIEVKIKTWLDKPEAIFLLGARQVGKTTVFKKIASDLEKEGRPTFYVNFDDLKVRSQAQEDPVRFLISLLGPEETKRKYIFLDEFQKLPEITEAVKILFDEKKEKLKFFLSGSGSIISPRTSWETLAGRALRFNLYSFSFLEFLQVKPVSLGPCGEAEALLGKVFFQPKKFSPKKLESLLFLEKESFISFFSAYLFCGGHPRIVTLSSPAEILTIYQGIKEAFLEKDMRGLIKTENLYFLEKLMEALAARIGNIISFEGLSRDLQFKIQTIKNFSSLLERSFWLKFIYPLSLFGGEYKRSPKVYFHDIGFRNGLLRLLALPNEPVQLGQVAENLVFNILCRFFEYQGQSVKINFWQSYKQAGTDFVVDIGKAKIGIESKYQYLRRPILGKGAKSFCEKYQPEVYLVINRNLFAQENYQKARIFFLPLWAFGLLV